VSRYQKGKTNLDFTEARDSEWQRHQLGHMQVCTVLQTEAMPAPHHSVFLQAGCPSCRPTNSVKALKAQSTEGTVLKTVLFIYIFIRINCSFKNKKFKKNKGKRYTQRVKEHNVSNAYTNYAQRKRKDNINIENR